MDESPECPAQKFAYISLSTYLQSCKLRCFKTVTSYQRALLGNNILFIMLIFAGWFKASMKTIGIWMENG